MKETEAYFYDDKKTVSLFLHHILFFFSVNDNTDKHCNKFGCRESKPYAAAADDYRKNAYKYNNQYTAPEHAKQQRSGRFGNRLKITYKNHINAQKNKAGKINTDGRR